MMPCARDDPTLRRCKSALASLIDDTGLSFEAWPLPADYT